MGKWLLVIAQIFVCLFVLYYLTCVEKIFLPGPIFRFVKKIIWNLFSGHLSFIEFPEWISVRFKLYFNCKFGFNLVFISFSIICALLLKLIL